MTAPWLSVVGVGEDGLRGVSPAARALVDTAEVLIGGERHLAMVPDGHPARRMCWLSPLKDTISAIRQLEGQKVCVLATGDPMSFGIGVTLARAFGADALTIHPVPGAFSLAAARLAWPLEDVTRLTLHGRPLDRLRLCLYPGARLLILSEDGATPLNVARLLSETGFGESTLTVLEHLGGTDEALHRLTAQDATSREHLTFRDLNVMAVDCIAGPGAIFHPRGGGLPDDAFLHDGQLTKREVRAATLSALAPFPGALLWDIGSGNGSVAIEWMRLGGAAIGIEPNAERRDRAARNAGLLGVPDLRLIDGRAPDVLSGLAPPDAVFVGGGAGTAGVLEAAYDALPAGGRLVANAVTVESEARLVAFHQLHGGSLTRLAVSRLEPVGPHHGWRPLMPVTQYALTKGVGA